jgi:ABC-type polysaccharide/polyol phosphate transport system ATPase subunit
LDEVFSAGDIHWMEKAQRRMRELIDRSSILVLVSHQMELIERYCDQAIWLQNGRIVQTGEPAEIVAAYQSGAGTGVSAKIEHAADAPG